MCKKDSRAIAAKLPLTIDEWFSLHYKSKLVVSKKHIFLKTHEESKASAHGGCDSATVARSRCPDGLSEIKLPTVGGLLAAFPNCHVRFAVFPAVIGCHNLSMLKSRSWTFPTVTSHRRSVG